MSHMCAGGFFHYNKDSTTYRVARDAATLFQDEYDNPLIKVLYLSKKEINDSDVLVQVTRRVTAVMTWHHWHVVSRRAMVVTRRVRSGSEAPARCPKIVNIIVPLRDSHGSRSGPREPKEGP
jgi:hypothetical protein